MGGEGSGRKPDPVKQLIGFNQPTPTGADSLYLPNYAGVQEVALKTRPSITPFTGETDPIWTAQSGAYLLTALSGSIAAYPVVAAFNSLSGGAASISGAYAITSGAFAILSGEYASTSGAFAILSGEYAQTSGAYALTSGAVVVISGATTAHMQDASDPHGTLLTQTGLSVTTISGATILATTTLSGANVYGQTLISGAVS